MSPQDRGQGMTEYLVVLALLLAAVIGGIYVVTNYPDWASKTLLVAVAGALIAGISWAVKQTISMVNMRAQLLVFELLSKNQSEGLSRTEIDEILKREFSVFRYVPGLTIDALSHLVNQKQVVASAGRYKIPEKGESKEPSTPAYRRIKSNPTRPH